MATFHSDDGPAKTARRKVCLATTSYDSPEASYTYSLQASREALSRAAIDTAYFLLQGNCHVDDARNSVVAEFLASDCDELIFIDADVSWAPEALVQLCSHDSDIVGGVYPYRRDDKPGEMPVRLMNKAKTIDGLLEVEGLPTGFMKIKRRVLERLARIAEKHVKDNGKVIPILFERVLIDGVRWGGDLHFCNKWRELGGRVYADPDIMLGHVSKKVLKGSLSAALRVKAGTTLSYVCDRIRRGKETTQDISEAMDYIDNPWGAQEDTLITSIALARSADGPIIEAGSGLSTILMAAAAPEQIVYCLEHHGVHAAKLKQMSAESGITNIGLCVCPIVDGWYSLREYSDLPAHFALGVNDGPPRQLGDRLEFFKAFRPDVVLCDDADSPKYAEQLRDIAASYGEPINFIGNRAAIIGHIKPQTRAA